MSLLERLLCAKCIKFNRVTYIYAKFNNACSHDCVFVARARTQAVALSHAHKCRNKLQLQAAKA